jgi:hypothetical protein
MGFSRQLPLPPKRFGGKKLFRFTSGGSVCHFLNNPIANKFKLRDIAT